jgi:hemoglobin-like flavoprotein
VDTNQLRDSFSRIAPRKEEFAASFYQALLEKYPHLRQFFVGVDLKRQQTSLIATLQAMLSESERGEALRTMFRKIGQKHAARQIGAACYPAFGQTLLETLALYDPQWTEDLRQDWATALEQSVRLMMESYHPDATTYRVQVNGARNRPIRQT